MQKVRCRIALQPFKHQVSEDSLLTPHVRVFFTVRSRYWYTIDIESFSLRCWFTYDHSLHSNCANKLDLSTAIFHTAVYSTKLIKRWRYNMLLNIIKTIINATIAGKSVLKLYTFSWSILNLGAPPRISTNITNIKKTNIKRLKIGATTTVAAFTK